MAAANEKPGPQSADLALTNQRAAVIQNWVSSGCWSVHVRPGNCQHPLSSSLFIANRTYILTHIFNMIKPDIRMSSSEEDLKMTETPTKKQPMRDDNKNIASPVKRPHHKMGSPFSKMSPLRNGKSQSYSCLHQHSPSQITARKLLRKYNSNVVKMSGQR